MIQSIAQQRGIVAFPAFTGERIYMQPFFQRDGLPKEMGRWQPTVDAMLDGIKTDQPIYLMVDQGIILPSTSHRRPGIHVDGYWNPGPGHGSHRSVSAHGGNRGGHGGYNPPEPAPSHGGRRSHGGYREPEPPRHRPSAPRRHGAGVAGWDRIDFSDPEAIILASDVSACVAYTGEYDEQLIIEGGDARHINVDHMERHVFNANTVYAGNVALLHESVPLATRTQRTLVRLNVPGWTP